ncbi:MAG: lysyl oxidase family protein [Chloroflexi bacterium]|nr:lysyl oxidase family protein [Chloroflexota bacterium]
MATDRSGWKSPGPAKLVALAVLTALVVGGVLVASWGDGAREVSDASEKPVRVETNANTGGEPEATSAAGSPDGEKREKEQVTSTDEEGADEPASGTPTATVAEPAEVSIVAASRLVSEAAPAVFRLTRTGQTGLTLTVAVGVVESGSMLAGEGRETVTFEAGARTTTLSVALADDNAVEETSRVSATVIAGAGYVASAHAGSADVYVADNDRVFLLPDLVADPPVPAGGPEVVWWNGEEMLVLRFEGYVTNLGEGPLDISGNPQLTDPNDPTSHDVWQRVRTTTGDWVKLTRPPVRFETDDGHNHFHLMEIVAYSLWDEAGTTQILPGAKVGFCMLDVESLPDRHSNPGEQAYEKSNVENCRADEPDADFLRMGVTEGWRDVYKSDVTFQWVDVSDLSPGHYRLAAESDPYDIVVESDETNNGVAMADELSVVPGYVAQPLVVETEPGTAVQIGLEATVFGSPGARVFRVVTPPANGTLDVAAGLTLWGTLLWYTPDEGFSGVDTFEYEAFDWSSAYPRTDPRATVTVQVGE